MPEVLLFADIPILFREILEFAFCGSDFLVRSMVSPTGRT